MRNITNGNFSDFIVAFFRLQSLNLIQLISQCDELLGPGKRYIIMKIMCYILLHNEACFVEKILIFITVNTYVMVVSVVMGVFEFRMVKRVRCSIVFGKSNGH